MNVQLDADKSHEQRISPKSEANTQRAPGESDEQALRKQLADEPEPAGANCQPHCDLLLPPRRPGQQKRGKICACDQQNQADHTQQNAQWKRELVSEPVESLTARRQYQAIFGEPALCFRGGPRAGFGHPELPEEDVKAGMRLLFRNPRLQPAHYVEPPRVGVFECRCAHRHDHWLHR